MKKRTNSQSAVTTPTNSKVVTTSSSQNYLHMLKQSSSAYKANKVVNLTKAEPVSSFIKASSAKNLPLNRPDTGFPATSKLNSLFSSFTPTASSQKQFSTSIAIDLRTTNTRDNPKVEKAPASNRNNSEPRVKNPFFKQFEALQQKATLGSFNPTEDANERVEDLFSTPKTRAEKINNNIKTDPIKVMSNSSEKIGNFSGVSSLESNGSNKLSTFTSKKHTQSSANEILNESFDTYKGYKNLSEEGDSRSDEKCMNHPNKRAKYFTTSEDELQIKYNLCSKCAVALADKGAKVKEISNSEEDLRRSEIEAFLIKLSHSRKHSTNIIESISLKKGDFIEFFNKQNEKAEAIAAVLQKAIQEELNQTKKGIEIQKTQIMLAMDSFEQQLRAGFKEVEEMQSDIERNFENILKHIELTPFKKIIDSYYSRLYSIDQHLETVRGQKLEVGKLPSVKSKSVHELKILVQNFFDLRGLKTSILKKMEGEREDESPRTSGESSRQTNKSSLGISFENKDILESANGSVFESYREPDRFSFACDQSAIMKAHKNLTEGKSPTSASLQENLLKSSFHYLHERNYSDF